MKKNCNANACPKPRLKWSKYCWWHQDWLSLTIFTFLITVIITVILFFIQERHPDLKAECSLLEDDLCAIQCSVKNSGRAEAKSAYLTFTKLLPEETKIFSKPEYGEIKLIEAEKILNPNFYPKSVAAHKVFSVWIARIPPKKSVEFTIRTMNSDNVKTGKQILYIEKKIAKILRDFYSAMSKKYSDITKDVNLEILVNYRMKKQHCFFTPAKLSYEKGIEEISYFTKQEEIVAALNNDLYEKYKKDFIKVFQNRPNFFAPVIRIKTSEGPSTYGRMLPYVKTHIDFEIPAEDILEKGEPVGEEWEKLEISIPVPLKYDYEE